MKKNSYQIGLLTSLLFLLFLSCKKDALKTTEQQQGNSPLFEKISTWLDKKQSKFTDSGSIKAIASLKQNLILSELRTEILSDSEKLIIVPIKNDFRTINITSQKTFKSLVITERNNNRFLQGAIFEVIPKDQEFDKLPINLIANIYQDKDSCALNGTFSLLTLTNKFMHEKEYKNGKLFSIKYLSTNKGAGENERLNGSQNTQRCTDWYLITTYSNGYQTEQYLYTSCDNDCNSVRTMDLSTPFKIECGDGAGAGGQGSGNNSEEPHYRNDQDIQNITLFSLESDGLGAPPVRYRHNAQVYWTTNPREIDYVIIDPTTLDPMVSFFIDYKGRNTTRTFTLFGHFNKWTDMGSAALINWNCFVYRINVFTNTDPPETDAWPHVYSTVAD